MDSRSARVRLAVVATLFVSLLLGDVTAGAEPRTWATAWSTPFYDPGSFSKPFLSDARLRGRTVRNIVRPTLSGSTVRLRFSNRFGKGPLEVGPVRIGRLVDRAGVVDATPVLFAGQARVTIDAGATAYSDPLTFSVTPQQKVAVSLFLEGNTAPASLHFLGGQTAYLSSPGAHLSAGNSAFHEEVNAWLILDRLEVNVPIAPITVVAVGDSITAGVETTVDADRRWTDVLDRALSNSGRDWAVLNAGINGGTAVWPNRCFGGPAVARLTRDALSTPRLDVLILMLGINDLIQPTLQQPDTDSACTVAGGIDLSAMKTGFTRMASETRTAGARLIVATIPPFGRSEYWSENAERARQEMNQWLRTSLPVAAVLDIANVLADSSDPTRLRATYDSGDGLHPNDAGHEAIGLAVAGLLSASSAVASTTNAALSIIDTRDGQSYNFITLGGLRWTAENLRHAVPGSTCVDLHAANCLLYGRLYNFQEALNACPPGWRLPSDEDWMKLEEAVGVPTEHLRNVQSRGQNSGSRLKVGGDTEFNVVFAGYSDPHKGFSFRRKDETAAFWTATLEGADDVSELAWHRDVGLRHTGIYRSQVNVTYRLSVRCVAALM